MFIEFDCGCIGFDIPKTTNWDGEDRQECGNILVYRCDYNSPDYRYAVEFRDMGEKTHKPLSLDKTHNILCELGDLIFEGYKFKEVKRLLK